MTYYLRALPEPTLRMRN